MKDKPTKRLRLAVLDTQRVGRGVSKNAADLPPGLKRFFIGFKDHFGKIVSVNIFMVLGNFPLIFLIAALSGATQIPRSLPASDLFHNLFGLSAINPVKTPADLSVIAMEGIQRQTLAPTTLTYVLIGIGLLTFFTFGLVNVGTAYILRNLVSGEPVFLWHDFFYAVKRNVRQALPFGIFDLLVSGLLVFNVYYMFSTMSSVWTSVLFWANAFILLVWFFMRFYVYIQMVTFKLKTFKIIKNSLIFSLLGFKRNILVLLGIAVIVLLEVLCLFGVGGFLMPFAVAGPLVLYFSLFAYMKVYAAYFKIKQYMIDPYLAEHPEERPEESEDEAIMTDDVTARERLDEIKRRNGID